MPTYSIQVSAPESGDMEAILNRIAHVEDLLDQIADESILPLLARNYDRSGLRKGTETLRNAVSKRGAKGNIIRKTPGQWMVGVDVGAYPHFKWAIDGRGAVRAKSKSALHFKDADTGKDVFAKSVKASPPHEIFHLDESDLTQIEADLNARIASG